MRPPRLIALLTDFGQGDPYVAEMKGVILSRLPGAAIIDVTHEVRRHDVRSAAYHLHCVERYFPTGTIFVCVVDPGVGTARPILLLERAGRTFLAPGNGLLEYTVNGTPGERWYAVGVRSGSKGVSPTFHGRDLFAPAAAKLAAGSTPGSLARRIPAPAPLRLFTAADRPTAGLRGVVLHVDRFGNIVTNIRVPEAPAGRWSARIAGATVSGPYRTYDDAPAGRPFLIRGSTGLLEVSVRRGDAAGLLGAVPGNPITFRNR